MSRENFRKESYKLIELLYALSNKINSMESIETEKRNAVVADIKKLSAAISASYDLDGADEHLFSNFFNGYGGTIDFINDYINEKSNAKLNADEKQLLSQLKEINKIFTEENSIIDRLSFVIKESKSFIDGYHSGTEDFVIDEQFARIGAGGTKPSLEELRTLSPSNPDINKTMAHMQWLIIAKQKASRLFGDAKESYYTKTVDRFQDELIEGTPEEQILFAKALARQTYAINDAAYKKYQELYNSAPQGSDPEEYAMDKLRYTEEYTAAEAMSSFAIMIKGSYTADFVKHWDILPGDEGDKLSRERESNKFIGPLLAGGMGRYIKEHGLKQEESRVVSAYEMGNYDSYLNDVGFFDTQDFEDILPDYEKMINDKESKSTSFKNMEDAMKDLFSTDSKDAGYNEKLEHAKQMSLSYLDTHKGYRFHDYGKERVRIANSFVAKITAMQEKIALKNRIGENLKSYMDPAAESEAIMNAVNTARAEGLTADVFAEKMKALDIKADPNLKITNSGLELSPEEQLLRSELNAKARDTYFKSQFTAGDISFNIERGKYFDELRNPEANQYCSDPDMLSFLLDYGREPETIRRNLDVLRMFTGEGYPNLNTPARQEERQRDMARIIEERINKIAAKDYDRYKNMSDAELVENYQEMLIDVKNISVLKNAMDKLAGNQYVKEESYAKGKELYEKYADSFGDLQSRMEIIINPYYAQFKTDNLTNEQIAKLGAAAKTNNDVNLSRFAESIKNAKQLNPDNIKYDQILKTHSEKYINSLKQAIDVGDNNAIVNSATAVLYTSLAGKQATKLEELNTAFSEDYIKAGVLSMKSSVERFVSEIPVDALKGMVDDKDFQKEFTHAFSYFQKNLNPEFKGKDVTAAMQAKFTNELNKIHGVQPEHNAGEKAMQPNFN